MEYNGIHQLSTRFTVLEKYGKRIDFVKTEKNMKHMRYVSCVVLAFVSFSQVCSAEPRIRANNEAYFQDEDFVKANAHTVDSLAYGESLYLTHVDQDLAAIVRLEQERLKGQDLTLHPSLLLASIAAKQGLNDYAAVIIDEAQTDESSIYDLDRLFMFQAELAYEQRDFARLTESVNKVREPDNLPDPDAYYYLRIQNRLANDEPGSAQDSYRKMALSPWQAISGVNIALWHYRKNDYKTGLDLLYQTLAVIDETIHLDADEYWYEKGRRTTAPLSKSEHAEQQQELAELSERILSLIGFGHLKIIAKDELQVNSLEFEEHLEQARTAIFEIPQDSRYATQGLELLAQSLTQLYEAQPQETLFADEEKQQATRASQKQQLIAILDMLTQADRPILTRLRSAFAKINLLDDEKNQDAQMAVIDSVAQFIGEELQVRRQLAEQPTEYFESLLSPFYNVRQLKQGDGFSLKKVNPDTLPLHSSQLINWLSQPQTKDYLKTLRFLSEGLAFTEEWDSKKDLLRLQVNLARQQDKTLPAQLASIEPQQTSLRAQTANMEQLLVNTPLLASNQEAKLLTEINRLQQQLAAMPLQGLTPTQQEWIRQRQGKLHLQRGEIIWQQQQSQQARRTRAKMDLNQAERTLASNSDMMTKLTELKQPSTLQQTDIARLNLEISQLAGRVEAALNANQQLFVDSFKSMIQQDLAHLQAAYVNLKLRQAVALQNAGEKDD